MQPSNVRERASLGCAFDVILGITQECVHRLLNSIVSGVTNRIVGRMNLGNGELART
jgi:hypothetical protein